MFTASLLLGALAVALAWPVPLVLWQSIALAGGLSMIGALLTFGLIPFGERLIPAADELSRSISSGMLPSTPVLNVLALCASLLLGVHLVFNLVLTAVRIRRARRRHRELIELLSSPVPDQPGRRMIDLSLPIAYCLPGTSDSVTVFSAGLVDLLTPPQLTAVIEHERAHLLQRHYLVLLAFAAWRTSLPWFPIATTAQREVGMLIEMVADDRARTRVDDIVLATAIALVAGASGGSRMLASGPLAELDAPARDTLGSGDTAARVDRLTPVAPLAAGPRMLVLASAIALVAVPTALLLLG